MSTPQSLPLTLVSSTETTETLSWPEVPGATGYEFFTNGVRSNTWNGPLTQATFKKNAKIQVIALGVLAQGVYPPVTPPPSGNGSVSGRWFTDASYINEPVGANPALDPNSAEYMKTILAQQNNIFFDTDVNSVPVYLATATTPTRSVALQIAFNGSSSITIPYQVGQKPPDPKNEDDGHFSVLRADTGDYFEFQGFVVAANGTLSAHSVATGNVITGDGVVQGNNWISVVSTMVGLIRPSEVAAGVIPHGLRLAIDTASSAWKPPAGHSDGDNPNGPPAGAFLWLPPSVSLAGLDEWQTMVCTALQTYRNPIGDENGGGSITGYVEATVDGSTYPLPITSIPSSIVSQMVVLAS
jgi:hypothetical protein